MAALMWLLPSDGMLGFGCFVATGVGFWILWDFLFRDTVLRLTRVSAMGCLLGYSGGTLNTWLTLPRAGYSLASRTGLMRGELSRGVAATILAAVLLLAVGELLERPLLDASHSFVILPGLKRIALAALIAIVPMVASGKLIQGGLSLSSAGHAGVMTVLFNYIVIPTVILSTLIFLTEEKRSGRFFWGAIALLLWVLQLDLGRRNLVYAAVITVALARHAGYQWNRLSFRQIILIGFGGAFLVGGFLMYQLMRVASYGEENVNLGEQLSTVATWAEQGRAWKIATASTQQNLEGRTFVVWWFSDLLQLSSTYPTAHGRDTAVQMEEAIPSFFLRNKTTVQEEEIASEQFGRNYPDQSNSLMTAGVIDFGLVGAIVYPLVFVFAASFGIHWIRDALEHEIFVYGLMVALLSTIATEMTLTGYVGSIRNTFILAVGLYAILRLPSFRLRAYSI